MHTINSLIKAKKWDQVSYRLCRPSRFDSEPHKLHYILFFNPPLSVIRDITETFPEVACEMDLMLRYPLHTALQYGASVDIIIYLIKMNKKAVNTQDIDGKTALHHLFTHYKKRCKIQRESSYFQETIRALCNQNRDLILKEDSNNMNVIEYAIEEEVDVRTMKFIQLAVVSTIKGQDDLSWFRQSRIVSNELDEHFTSRSKLGKAIGVMRKALSSRELNELVCG